MSHELSPIPRPHFRVPSTITDVDLVEAFLAGRKPTTLRAYENDIDDFAKFMGSPSGREAIRLLTGSSHGQANAIALGYRTHLQSRGLKTATIARRLAALRSLVKLARTLGLIPWTLEIPSPKIEAFRDTSGPGDAGWRKVLALAKAEAAAGTPIGIRNLLLVRMLHDLGLRRGELVSIDLAAVPDLRFKGTPMGEGHRGSTKIMHLMVIDDARSAWGWVQTMVELGPLLGARGATVGEPVLCANLAQRGASSPYPIDSLVHDVADRLTGLAGSVLKLATELRDARERN